MDKVLVGLNKEQLGAVTHGAGPLLIIAGAGTGKTRVITQRIAWLINQGLAKTDEILALTFTDKAAKEMQERVDILMPYGYTDIWISTFHAFGDRILRENALVAGLNPDFKVLARPEAAVFFREHLFEFTLNYYRPLAEPTRFIEALISFFSRAKDEDISAKDYLKYAQDFMLKVKAGPKDEANEELAVQQMEVAGAYVRYQELLAKEGLIDFGNQFYLSLQLLREHPLILENYQKQFKYILVDEFQDTNFAQFQIVKLMAGSSRNITVVADDDQCLPGDSLIETPAGKKQIKEIKEGDEVLTAVGKSHIGISKVKKVFRRQKKARFITFKTESGRKITVTSEHKMFCYVPPWPKKIKDKIYYVYLMWRKGLGWRLGITNDLAVRLKLERSADKIVGLRAFKTEREAQYLEVYLSLKYGIPTICFKERKGILIVDEWLEKLYKELHTEGGVRKLAEDLDINLDFHHYCLAAVTRGSKVRVKINLHFCYRKYISKGRENKILINPSILHCVTLETSDEETLDKIRKIGLRLKKTKKAQTLRYCFTDINKAENFAFRLKELTDGILEYKFTVAKFNIVNLPALMMPASNILMGHYLPVMEEANIVYDRIVGAEEEIKQDTVYDLEIEKTHNYIANEVVVHNCIYRWRGAAYSNVMNFNQEYPKAKQITLIKNYRSTQPILDSAYQLIQYNNPERFEVKANIDKHLIGLTKKGDSPAHLHFDTHSAEADNVSKIIKDKVSSGGFKFRDFAILVRSNSDARGFIQSLNMENIPWQFSGNQGLYGREEVKVCINYLRVIANPSDSLSLYYLVSSEVYKVNLADLTLCNHFARRRNLALYAVFNDLEKIPELSQVQDETKKKIKQVLTDIEKFLQVSRDETTGRLLYSFLTDTGYLKYLTHNPSLEKETKIQNIAKFFNQVRDFELVAKEDRVISFIRHLSLLIESGDDPPTVEADLDQDAVNILTIHKAKGLEFGVVFLVSLVQGKFPLPKRSQQIELPDALIKEVLPTGDFHTQEERRLFYVGMTRAKVQLYLTSAEDYGGKRLRKVSQFVPEALGKKPGEDVQKKKTAAIESIQRFAQALEFPKSSAQKIPEDKLVSLSYYQIDDYLTCPLKYKYVNILRVPIMEHHTVIYGRAMHEAVSQYLLRKLKGDKVALHELLDCFEANFDPQGFLDVSHQEERFRIGREALTRFYKDEEDRKSTPKFIEESFSFVIGNNKISGRFDRIDQETGGAVIMDFKTSAIKTQKDADKRVKESKQLALYALAHQYTFGALPIAVALYFLESGIIGRYELEEDDLEDIKEDILEVSAGIRQQNYPAKPEYKACTYCAYNQICPQAVIR